MKQSEVIKHAREMAKNNGLTFKVDHTCKINSKTAYKIINRSTGLVYKNMRAMTLTTAYGNLCAM